MIGFAAIKKLPEFEFLDSANQETILKAYLETYIESYKKLDASGKKEVEKEIFQFYGINVKSTKKVVSKAFENIKVELDGVKDTVKSVKDDTSSAVSGISKQLSKYKQKDFSSDFDELKNLMAGTMKEGETKTLLKAIGKNKPKDISPKIDEVMGVLSESKIETAKAIKALVKEIGKNKPVGWESKIDELKVMLANSRVDTAIQNLTEEISKKTPKEWEFKVERDHKELIQGITAVQVV